MTEPSLGRRLLGGGLWVLAGKGVTAGSNLVISALLARLLSSEAVGNYGLAMSMVTFGAIASQLGLHQAIVRVAAEARSRDRSGRARGAIVAAYRLVLGGVAATAITLLALGGWLAREVWGSAGLATVMLAIVAWTVLQTLQVLTSEAFRGLHDLRLATIFGGVVTNALALAALAALWLGGSATSLMQVILLTVGAAALSLLLGLFLLRRKISRLGPTEPVAARELLAISLPLWVSGLTMLALQKSDLWILGFHLPQDELASYYIASYLVSLVSMSLMQVNLVVPPFIAELHAKGEQARLQRLLRSTATVAGLPAFLALGAFVLFGERILVGIYGDPYRSGGIVLAILSVGRLVNVLTGSCGVTMSMTGHQRQLMRITVFTGGLTVGAILAVAGRWGPVGAAWAVTAGVAVQNVWLWLATRRHTGLWTHVGWPRPAEFRALFRRS